ncbi:MAG: hypothetical protein IIV99_06480 [Oscillospiraceae bacterium]|nr:hypothetical protein [Oscillospiraceae bacterium]
MLNLIFAIICSSMLSILMRISESKAKNNIALLVVNYISCTLVALYDTGLSNVFNTQTGFGNALLLGVISGFVYLASFVLLQYNVQKNGVVLSATFMKLGLLVSTGFSIIVYRERPDILQIIGFAVAIAAIIIINSAKDSDGKKQTAAFKLGLIVMLVCSGMGDALSKVFEETGVPFFSNHYLLFTFGSACVLCVLLMLYKKQKIGVAEMVFGAMLGVPNYLSSKFLLRSLDSVPAVVAFPTFSVGCILVVTVVGLFVFREKLTRKQSAALAMIMAALAMLNM